MKRGRKPFRIHDLHERLLQGVLPFAEEETIDVRRAATIMHVSDHLVFRLIKEKDGLAAYQTMKHAPHRIYYESLVDFLERVRKRYSIPDRRPQLVFGRHRDDDLLPFPWPDTITIDEAAAMLGIHPSKVLLRIQAGMFEAYQLLESTCFEKSKRGTSWRISKSSLRRHIASFRTSASLSSASLRASESLSR